MKKYLFSQKDLLGYCALWAVKQSPYACPENLQAVLEKFANDTRQIFEAHLLGFAEMELEEIGFILDTFFFSQYIVEGWNERKNGNQQPYNFVSRLGGEKDPDNDFIDLGALRRNILNCFKFDKVLSDAIEEGNETIKAALQND